MVGQTAELGVVRLRVVCAWCRRELTAGREPVSHGICEPCAAQLEAEVGS